MLWSAVTVVLVVLALGRRRRLMHLLGQPRTLRLLAFASLAITVNWGLFIYGVNSGRVVETSLGYFVNPLVTVLLGVLVLRERLRPAQWAAVGIATVAVLVIAFGYGRPPWIALGLAGSFAAYGLTKKRAGAGALEGLTVEAWLVAPLALGWIVWLGSTGTATVGSEGTGHLLLVTTTGIVTVVPLACFSAAATRIPLSTLGLLQYLTPVTQFLIGVLVRGEEMPPSRWVGFALVWLALLVFISDSLRHRRRSRVPATL